MTKDSLIQFLNHYLSLATIIGGGVLVVVILYVTYILNTNRKSRIVSSLYRFAIPLAFLITFFGTGMSLFYSEYLGILPCDLCWFQRVFIYSQLILFAVAWWKDDKGAFVYSFWLSVVGLCIGLYHHIMQLGYDVYRPCSTAPFAVDCSKPTFIEYGFVTFPLMAVVLFATLIFL